jgi:hypothetical protein
MLKFIKCIAVTKLSQSSILKNDGNKSLALSKIADVKVNVVNVLHALFYDTLAHVLSELQRNLQYI